MWLSCKSIGLLTAIVLSAACSAERGDILSAGTNEFGGKLSQGAWRANVAVSDDNKLEISHNMIHKIFSAFEGSLQSLASSPDTGSARKVRMPGRFYGYAEVSGSASMHENNRGMSFDVKLNFYDYSDSGAVFFGGMVNCLGALEKRGSSMIADSLVLAGGMAFAGDYQGSVVFDSLFVPMEYDGRPVSAMIPTYCEMGGKIIIGNMIVQSGGRTLRFNPWYRQPTPCP